MSRHFSVLVSALLLAACASTAKPILYPNEHLNLVGKDVATRDIDICTELAESAGASSSTGGQNAARTAGSSAVGAASGAVGGAVIGSVAAGAAAGAAGGATAGLLHSVFSGPKRNPAFESFVNRCLQERGYQVVGWD